MLIETKRRGCFKQLVAFHLSSYILRHSSDLKFLNYFLRHHLCFIQFSCTCGLEDIIHLMALDVSQSANWYAMVPDWMFVCWHFVQFLLGMHVEDVLNSLLLSRGPIVCNDDWLPASGFTCIRHDFWMHFLCRYIHSLYTQAVPTSSSSVLHLSNKSSFHCWKILLIVTCYRILTVYHEWSC